MRTNLSLSSLKMPRNLKADPFSDRDALVRNDLSPADSRLYDAFPLSFRESDQVLLVRFQVIARALIM
jgi:hypothetical protein